MRSKLKSAFKFLWNQLKDWRNIVIFLVVKLVFDSPIIVGYTLFFITKNKYHLIYANATLGFWCSIVPEIPIAICITTAIRKILNNTIWRNKK